MKKNYSKREAEQFTSQLIRTFSDTIRQEEDKVSPSPFFMARIHARIRETQSLAHWWEAGVINAQNWLVALSLIAFIFFVSNVVLMKAPPRTVSEPSLESLTIAENDWEQQDEAFLLSNEVAR